MIRPIMLVASGTRRTARFGPFEVDLETGELSKQGRRIQLQPKPQQLLLTLLDNPGAVITREELRARLWGEGTFVDFESGLNTAANRLRVKLGDSADNPRYIETLPRVGYRFIAPVEIVEPGAEEPAEKALIPATPPPQQRSWRTALIICALAVVVVAAIAAARTIGAPGIGKQVVYRELTFRRGQVLGARFIPNSRSVLYTARWEDNPSQLFLAGESGPESRALGFSGMTLASISLTGELAFIASGGTANIGGGTLHRAPMNGSDTAYVDNGIMNSEFTADGKGFIVARAKDGRSQLEYPIGAVVHKTAGWLSNVRRSPVNDSVVFIEHPVRHDESGRLMIFEPGRGVRLLSDGWATVVGLAWAPSGKEVWFTAARAGALRSVWAADMTGRVRAIAQAPGILTLRDLSSDGRALLTRDTRRLEMAGRLRGDSTDRDLSWLDWSRVQEVGEKARVILFDEEGEAAGAHPIVYARHTDEQKTIRLGEGIAMGLSPDGHEALIASEDRQHLYMVPVQGGEPRKLRDTGLHYQWARYFSDARRVVVSASRPGEGLRLYIQDLNTASTIAISPEMMVRNAAVSPDGAWVAVLSSSNELQLLPTDSHASTRVLPASEPLAPIRWSRDGRWIYVQHLRRASDSSAQVSRVEVNTGRILPWMTIEPRDRMGVNAITGIALSPDCESYVYSYRRVLSELFLAEGW